MEIVLRLSHNMTIVVHSDTGVQNGLEYWNYDLSILIGYQFSTSCEILVRFGSMTLEFKT